jgi:hypothetical protein
LVLHLMLGYRRLRDISYYSDDPLVMRTLGLRRLPDVALGLRAPGPVSAQDPPARRPSHSTSGAAHPQHVRQYGGPGGVVALPRSLVSCLTSPSNRYLCNDRVALTNPTAVLSDSFLQIIRVSGVIGTVDAAKNVDPECHVEFSSNHLPIPCLDHALRLRPFGPTLRANG